MIPPENRVGYALCSAPPRGQSYEIPGICVQPLVVHRWGQPRVLDVDHPEKWQLVERFPDSSTSSEDTTTPASSGISRPRRSARAANLLALDTSLNERGSCSNAHCRH